MKVLILSCNTGEGHNSAAYALHEALLGFGEESEVLDTLQFGGERSSAIVTSSFNSIIRKAPSTFGFAYKAGDIFSATGITSPVYFANSLYGKSLLGYVEEGRFDAVICTHLFPMEALTYIRRKYQLGLKCYGVLTDYTCVPFIAETDLDGYFIPHEDLLGECVGKGIPREKIACTGIPVAQKFVRRLQRSEARNHLVIPQDLRMYMIMTGGIGCGQVLDLCGNILDCQGDKAAVYALCGRNDQMKEEIEEQYHDDPRVQAVVFTEKVNIYMNATDVLLSKPGGITSTEAAVSNVPLVHAMAIPGCETKNAAFFAKRGMSMNATTLEEAVRFADMLIQDKGRAQKMCEKQRENCDPRSAERIASFVRDGL